MKRISKQISGRRPVVFYQPACEDDTVSHGDRLRIFYPNGKVEWATLRSPQECATHGYEFIWIRGSLKDHMFHHFNTVPCWIVTYDEKKARSMREALKKARDYDRSRCYDPMVFVTEL